MRMNIIDRRVYFSLGLTLFFIIISTVYIKPNIVNKEVTSHKIAFLKGAINNVQKKSTGQVLWQDISLGEELAQGDFLRTSTNSSAEVIFLDSTDKIKLGPETTVIIEMNQSKIALNMIEGAIFVDNFKSDSVIDLTAGSETFKFQNSQINLDLKSEEAFELEVLSGSVNTTTKKISKNERLVVGKDGSAVTKNYFEFQKPEIGKNIHIDPTTNSVKFIWKGHKSRYQYDLFIGRSKTNMTKANKLRTSNNELEAIIPPGVFYWQIKATSKVFSFESATIQSQFMAVRAPVLLDPQDSELVYLKINELANLKWALMSVKENAIVEISKDLKFKNIIFSKPITGRNSLELTEIREEGIYYWRIRGFLNSEFTELVSKEFKFNITYKKTTLPPRLVFPLNKQMFIKEEMKGISLAWDGVKEIKKYRLSIRSENGFQMNEELNSTNHFLEELPIGKYFWKVGSIGLDGKISKYSPELQFSLKSFPKIKLGGYPRSIYYNMSETFSPIEWETINGADSYKIKIKSSMLGEKTFDTTSSSLNLNLKFLGEYTYKVEAYKRSLLIAMSKTDTINVIEYPLLDSPKWKMKKRSEYITDGSGSLLVRFSTIRDKSYYIVEVRDLSSRVLKVIQSEKEDVNVKSLYPGSYFLYVRSVDKFNRKSDLGTPIKIVVPEKSDLAKPKLNKVNVR